MDLRFKKIKDYTELELEWAIRDAEGYCSSKNTPTPQTPLGLDFWRILRGVDAYMEKRKRKEELELHRELSNPSTSLGSKDPT